jgi:soluble lytic murein transglycosylase-like protein
MNRKIKLLKIVGAGTLLSLFLLSFKIEGQVKPQGKKPYDKIVKYFAQKYGIDSALIHSIIKTESNYDSQAISPKGAKGLMQLMPETAKLYGVKNVFDPEENIEGGVRYIKDLVKTYKRRTDLVLAAYNAGQEAIAKYGGRIPPYPETKNYIKKVKSDYSKPWILIRKRTKIYQCKNNKGQVVLTNDPYQYSLYKKKEKQKK